MDGGIEIRFGDYGIRTFPTHRRHGFVDTCVRETIARSGSRGTYRRHLQFSQSGQSMYVQGTHTAAKSSTARWRRSPSDRRIFDRTESHGCGTSRETRYRSHRRR
eukprot:Pompholyxophrys_punicea_v1_NODE_614_length_1594_cov_2.565302.p3 type:complete len:105 gc:universal NODE_614_length_1594_cov_2.565302:715-401(-)